MFESAAGPFGRLVVDPGPERHVGRFRRPVPQTMNRHDRRRAVRDEDLQARSADLDADVRPLIARPLGPRGVLGIQLPGRTAVHPRRILNRHELARTARTQVDVLVIPQRLPPEDDRHEVAVIHRRDVEFDGAVNQPRARTDRLRAVAQPQRAPSKEGVDLDVAGTARSSTSDLAAGLIGRHALRFLLVSNIIGTSTSRAKTRSRPATGRDQYPSPQLQFRGAGGRIGGGGA